MLNVFVFEEEPALRDTLAAFLTDEECRVVTPADISEAADAVVLERFDLMLCDYWMGETDGLSFFHVIRDRQRTAVKVLMTGYPARATQTDLRWAGIDYVIHKSAVFRCMDTLKASLLEASQVKDAGAAH